MSFYTSIEFKSKDSLMLTLEPFGSSKI